MSQANALNQIQGLYGNYQSFEPLLAPQTLTPRIRIYYLALDFEKGPLFAKFVVYRTASGWILTTFNFNVSEDAILPALPQPPSQQ